MYFWDWAGFWNQYIEVSRLFGEDPWTGFWITLTATWSSDYGPLPILPLVPLHWLLGDGRVGYVLGLTNLLVLPVAFAFAALAVRLNQARGTRPTEHRLLSGEFVLAASSILVLSSLWAPALRGQPEVAGLFLVVVVLWCLQRDSATNPQARSLVAQGVILALLVLTRRWYAYWVVAYFPAVLVAAFVADLSAGRPSEGWRTREAARRLLIVGTTFVAVFSVVATPILVRTLTSDYQDAYSAYDWNGSRLLDVVSVVRYFGAVELALAGTGMAILASRAATRQLAVVLTVQAIIAFGLFTSTQDMVAHHYYLIFPPVAIGVATVALTLYHRERRTLGLAAAVGVVLLVAAGSAITFTDVAGPPSPRVRTPERPFTRSDLGAIADFWDRLVHLDGVHDGRVYVVASSDTINADLLVNYCLHQIGLPRNECDFIMPTSDVDKRDGFPYGFDARYVVVASPVQYHLNPTGQRVVGVLAREVESGAGLGASFRRLPGVTHLDGGVELSMYERFEPIAPAVANAVIAELQGYYPENPTLFRLQ